MFVDGKFTSSYTVGKVAKELTCWLDSLLARLSAKGGAATVHVFY